MILPTRKQERGYRLSQDRVLVIAHCWVVWLTSQTHRVTWAFDFFFPLLLLFNLRGKNVGFLLYSKNILALIAANILCWQNGRKVGKGNSNTSESVVERKTHMGFLFLLLSTNTSLLPKSELLQDRDCYWSGLRENPEAWKVCWNVLQKALFPSWKRKDFFFLDFFFLKIFFISDRSHRNNPLLFKSQIFLFCI